MVKVKRIQRSIIIEEDLMNAIQDIADKENRSFSYMINILLKEVLDKRGKKK